MPFPPLPIAAGLMNLHQWGHSASQRLDWIKSVLDLGITVFDHADLYGGYGNEGLFGEALALEPAIRSRMFLVTKCDIVLRPPAERAKHYDSSPAYITTQVERSLQHLNTDHVEVLLLHRPDPLMNVDETAEVLHKLVSDGKVLHLGVSNFSSAQFDLLQSRLDVPLVTNQIQLSLLHVDPLYDGTLDQAQQHRAQPMAWSPLAGGRLFTGTDEQSRRAQAKLHEVARRYEKPVDQIALAWILRLPSRPIPVLGTGRIDRLAGAVSACDIDLDRETWFELLEASRGHEVA